jgi:choline kinase
MGGAHPKTLLPLGDHRPMLSYILSGLKEAGVDDLFVVTGFMPGEVQDFVTENWGEATYIHNARYASWGNFHTVRLAIDQSPGFDLMVVNSDIVVQPDVFRRVMAKEGDLVLAVQRRHRLDSEDMRVWLDKDRVRGVSKHLTNARSQGEFCGVSMLRGRAHRLYADIATEWQWRAHTHGYYEDVYNEMCGRVDVRASEVAAGEYAEVDTPEDVEAAVAVIERHHAAAAPA